MKKFDIDPLFLLVSSLFIFLLSIYILSNTKYQKIQSYNEFNKNIGIINQYSSLKSSWIDKKIQLKKVNKLIKILHIKNAKIIQNSNKMTVEIKSNINTLHRFLNKLLNEKLNIVKLKISKDTLKFEVGLI